jgi:hypothetical protein
MVYSHSSAGSERGSSSVSTTTTSPIIFLHKFLSVRDQNLTPWFFVLTIVFLDNLWEASEILRPMLGPAYAHDSTHVFRALWRSFKYCMFVEEDEDVAFFRNKQGEKMRELKYDEASDTEFELDSEKVTI